MSDLNNFFVKLQFLKENSLIHDNVNDDTLVILLRRVQKTKIEQILGTPFYKELLGKIPSGLSVKEQELLDDYLIPTLISYVEVSAALYINVEIRNKSVGRANDEFQQANDDSQSDLFQSNLYKNAKVYESTLIGYIVDNKDEFPTYCKWESDKRENVRPIDESNSLDNSISFITN